MLVEPVLGDEEKYPELMHELERPLSGTREARVEQSKDILAQFGMSFETVQKARKNNAE